MHFKLIIAFVEDSKTDDVMEAAREAGVTGCTVISNARGEGIKESKTFFGLTLATQRDVVLLLVEQHLSRHILEHIGEVGEFDAKLCLSTDSVQIIPDTWFEARYSFLSEITLGVTSYTTAG